MPAARCNGASAVTRTIVVQLGQDTIPFGSVRRSSGLTSATTSGTSGSMRNAAELSTTCAPRARRLRGPLGRERVVDVDDDEVEAVEAAVPEASRTRPRRPANARPAPLGARRGEDPQLVDREGALLEDPQHLGADQAGRADDPDPHVVSPAPARTRRAAPARRARRRRTLDDARDPDRRRGDHLDVDVLAGEHLEHRRPRHPGCVFMPAPTMRDAPDVGVVGDTAGLEIVDDGLHHLRGSGRGRPSGP